MIHRILVISLLLALLAGCGNGGANPAPTLAAAARPEIPTEVQDLLRQIVDQQYTPGIVAGIVNPAGCTFFSYGKLAVGGNQPVDEKTIFEIGSVTKVFTALLLAHAVEKGMVRLDTPAQSLLPDEVKIPQRNGKQITLEDLATHRSGLPRLPTDFNPKDINNPYVDFGEKEMFAFLSGYTLTRDIGSQFEYSNLGYALLGLLMEMAYSKPYEQLVKEIIASPLGMPDTGIMLSTGQQSRFASPHIRGESPAGYWDFNLPGEGGLRSTAADMLHFVAANLGVEQSGLQTAMQRIQEGRWDTDIPNAQKTLGWFTYQKGKKEIIWHNGETGGFHSFVGFVPAEKTGVVLLTNATYDIDAIGFHLLDPKLPLTPHPRETSVVVEVLQTYVGKYELAPGAVFDVTLENGQLMVQLTGQDSFPVFPESETTFFYKVVEASITFQKDSSGKVTGLVLSQGGQEYTAKRMA